MQEAILYDRQEGQVVTCRLCPWFCRIEPGASGVCRVRENREGTLYSLNYGLVSAAAAEPVERRGLYHFFPGNAILTLGGWGSNLPGKHHAPTPELPGKGEAQRYLDAEKAATFAVDHHCRGLAWNYQESAVWIEYVLDSAKMARANGLFTLLVTGGYLTEEALDELGPYLDGYAVEILGADAHPYELLSALPHWEAILQGTAWAQSRWRCHVEVHTPVIPGVNDSDEVIRALAGWIREQLGPSTPWHLDRYIPAGEMSTWVASTPEDLNRVQGIGREAGLQYVYTRTGEEAGLSATVCPSCGNVLVKREGKFLVRLTGVEGGKCTRCGLEIAMRRSIFK